MRPRDRLAPHLRPQIELRKDRLFAGADDMISGARVLEIAPNHCLFTEELLRKEAAHVTLVEYDRPQGEVIRATYEDHPRVTVVIEDIHTFLISEKTSFDVVVCAGFLYHTPHPLWILEGIARLRPKHILIDTAISRGPTPEVYPESSNIPGFRQSGSEKTCGLSLRLPKSIYLDALKALGYLPSLPVDQSPGDVTGLTPEQAGIVLGWSRTFSCWLSQN